MRPPRGLASAVLVLFCGGGCVTTRYGRVYDLDSAGTPLIATFRSSGSGHGPVWLDGPPENAPCQGEYVTIPRGGSGWGAIFTSGTSAFAMATMREDDQRGRAIVTCKEGIVIECEYLTSASTGSGHGACRDS